MAESLYRPLKNSEIRVLQLHPGDETQPLTGSFKYITLNAFPLAGRLDKNSVFAYDAVSYAWGEPCFDHSIYIYSTRALSVLAAESLCGTRQRSATFPRLSHRPQAKSIGVARCGITKSLSDALLRFRHLDKHKYLWADQICINQSNVEEKMAQIAIMAEIFRSARLVQVWLGPPQDHHNTAFSILRFLARLPMQKLVLNLDENNDDMEMPNDNLDILREKWARHRPGISLEDALHALSSIARKSWFTRLWVVQEILAARHDAYFYCGPDCVIHDRIFDAFSMLHLLAQHDEFPSLDMDAAWRTSKMYNVSSRRALFGEQPCADQFFEVLLETSHLKVSDPRDRVFALMSTGNMTEEFGVTGDYNITLAELWQRVSRYLCSKCILYKAVILALPATQSSETTTGSSWATDFGALTLESRRKQLWYVEEIDSSSAGFKGSKTELSVDMLDRWPLFKFEPSGETPSTLSSKGIFLGSVRKILRGHSMPVLGSARPSAIGVEELAVRLLRLYFSCRVFCQEAGFDITAGDLGLLLGQGITQSNTDEYRVPTKTALKNALDKAVDYDLGQADIEQICDTLSNLPVPEHISYMDHSRYIACTTDGYLGWIPKRAKTGDRVCLLQGCPAPFIVRKREDKFYDIVGDSYIHGIMHGEAWPEDHSKLETLHFK